MIGWIKTRLRQARVAKNLQRHMAAAVGPPIHRTAIAVAMTALDNELVEKERRKLSSSDQTIFMMAYECLVMWSLVRGLAGAFFRLLGWTIGCRYG
jgi:hypothetical protein